MRLSFSTPTSLLLLVYTSIIVGMRDERNYEITVSEAAYQLTRSSICVVQLVSPRAGIICVPRAHLTVAIPTSIVFRRGCSLQRQLRKKKDIYIYI